MIFINQWKKIDLNTHFGKIFIINGSIFTALGVLFALLFGFDRNYGLLIYLLAGLAMLLPGLLLLLTGKNHPAIEVLHRYYTALENQHYAEAFQYVNIVPKTPQDSQMTQDCFTSSAQKNDSTRGRISRYKINAYTWGWQQMSINVWVTRGRTRYEDFLTIGRQGDSWKIISFNFFTMH